MIGQPGIRITCIGIYGMMILVNIIGICGRQIQEMPGAKS